MRKRYLFLLTAFYGFVFVLSASATENIFYRGMRPMSMGGAFVAVADDENGRNWNPAGMMFLPGINLSSQLYGRATKDTMDIIGDIKYKDGELTADLVERIEEITNDLSKIDPLVKDLQSADRFGIRAGDGIDLVFPKVRKKKMAFGLGAYIDGDIDIWIKEQGLPIELWELVNDQMLYKMSVDVVPSFSGACRIGSIVPTFVKGGKRDLSVGLTVKYVNRIKASNEKNPYTIQELANGYRGTDTADVINFEKEINLETPGTSLGFDLGAITDLTDYMRLGVVVHDIGTNISYNATSIANDEIPMNVRVGTAFYPLKYFYPDSQRKFFNMVVSADIDNLNGDARESSDFTDKLHLGAEMKFSLFKDFLSVGLRGGSNQGYPTYGVTLHGLWVFQLDYTVYGDEFADYQNAAFSVVF